MEWHTGSSVPGRSHYHESPLDRAEFIASLITATPLPSPCSRLQRARIARPDSVVRPADHHRRAPRICPKEPIDRGLLVLPISLVARHLAIEHRLCRERRHQIVRAPDERNPDAKPVIRARDNGVEAATV